MADHTEIKQSTLNVDDIARPQEVIHPALDWVNDQLVVGVVFKDGHRAALTSRDGLVEIDKIGRVCERDGKFESPVTPEMAKEFTSHLDTKPTKCPREELSALLIELADYFSRFVIFPEKYWPRVVASWTIGTYLFPIFQAYPYLWLTSPEPGCGKSLLGQMLANVSFNGEFMASPTEANMFHLPEQNRGVQVWDEVEFANQVERSRFQSVKAILLNGYRNGGVVPRQVGKNWDQPVKYHVYCPRVLIGLSQLPETARQRTIMVGLRKRNPDQKAELYRGHDQTKAEIGLRAKCVLTALKCATDVDRFYKDNALRMNLEALLGKAGREVDDIWLPLFALVAASSDDAKIDPDLADAAVGLAKHCHNPTPSSSIRLLRTVSPGRSEGDRVEGSGRTLVAALRALNSLSPIEPTELAERLSGGLDTEVSAQWLSKNLQSLGIRAKKQGGRRVFNVLPREIERAENMLGIEFSDYQSAEPGQQGQDGQQRCEKVEELEELNFS